MKLAFFKIDCEGCEYSVIPGFSAEEWEKVGSDHPYHYLGSAIWFNRMGHAFGDALLDLMR